MRPSLAVIVTALKRCNQEMSSKIFWTVLTGELGQIYSIKATAKNWVLLIFRDG